MCISQTLSNGEWAFLMACGTVLQKNLQPGEKILVDTDSVLCFEQSITLDIQWVGNAATCCCGGEGYVPLFDVQQQAIAPVLLYLSLRPFCLALLAFHGLELSDCSTPH